MFCQKTLSSLEFNKICEILSQHAPTEGAKAMARMLSPSDDIDVVSRRQRYTTDARRLLEEKGITDIQSYFQKFVNEYNKTAVPYKKIGLLKIRDEEFPKNTLRKILRRKIDRQKGCNWKKH